ncbi:BnaC09g35970D [Brassica napus]|uniref:(rape) hypothetical protein n=1 Tax=Brassica napus TaxID=3708 RepID=A0A078GNV6_BRANA|nr:unnamed protein product [Brassica napus]CDY26986.1 BnaC09g35970D [Brassica napus]
MAKQEQSSSGLDHRYEDGAVRQNREEDWLSPEGSGVATSLLLNGVSRSLSLQDSHMFMQEFEVERSLATLADGGASHFDEMVSAGQWKYYLLGGKGGVGENKLSHSAFSFGSMLWKVLSVVSYQLISSWHLGLVLKPVQGVDSTLLALESNELDQLKERMDKVGNVFRDVDTTEFVIVTIPTSVSPSGMFTWLLPFLLGHGNKRVFGITCIFKKRKCGQFTGLLLIIFSLVLNPTANFAQDPVAMVLYAVVVSVCAPVWEEIVFRGFLLPSLTRYMRVWCTILVSSVAFALVHFNDVAVGVPWSGFGFVPFEVVAFA